MPFYLHRNQASFFIFSSSLIKIQYYYYAHIVDYEALRDSSEPGFRNNHCVNTFPCSASFTSFTSNHLSHQGEALFHSKWHRTSPTRISSLLPEGTGLSGIRSSRSTVSKLTSGSISIPTTTMLLLNRPYLESLLQHSTYKIPSQMSDSTNRRGTIRNKSQKLILL